MDRRDEVNTWEQIKNGDGAWVAGIWIPPLVAYPIGKGSGPWPEAWFSSLVNKFIPEMGEEYMDLFVACGFMPPLFFGAIENEELRTAIYRVEKTDPIA